MSRYIPQNKIALFKPMKTHTSIIHKQINEKYHVYKDEDQYYNNAIEDAIKKAIFLYKNKKDLIEILPGLKCAKAKINYNFGNIIKEVNLYLNIDILNQENFYNICFPTDEYTDNMFSSHKEEMEIYNKRTKQLEKREAIIFDNASIILICDFDIFNNLNYYIDIVRHELIHILHESIKSIVNEYAGYADTYALLISLLYNVNFPDYNILKNIHNAEEHNCALILAACIYYLDNSEYSAWLDTYNQHLLHIIRNHPKKTIKYINRCKTLPLIYQIMTIINLFLIKHADAIHNYFNFNRKNLTTFLIKEYLKIRKYKGSFNNLIKIFIKRSTKFLKTCDLIFIEKVNYEICEQK